MIRYILIVLISLCSLRAHAATSDVMCTMEYAPVCGEKRVQCIQAPCEPVRQTYSNACMASADGASVLWTGECNIAESTPIAVGGQRDAYGCLIGAGYSWDSATKQCVRPWEQKKSVKSALQAGVWQSVSLNGISITGGTLSFEKNTLHAKICNTLNGRYMLSAGGRLIVRNTMSTMMYCDGAIMKIEQALSRGGIMKMIVGDSELSLTTRGGDTILWKRP